MKPFATILTLFLAISPLMAQEPDKATPIDSASVQPNFSRDFAQYDTTTLAIDFYMPDNQENIHRCILYAYGGGFIENNQRTFYTREYCRKLADDGFVVGAIDYRLGLRGVTFGGTLGMIKPLESSIKMASEDMLKATKYVLDNAEELKVDPECIIMIGSSAGAITALQTDYELCNRSALTADMPADFRYAGVVSFSGAVFSREGKCDYKVHAPAPTLFLHGTSDRLVTYKQIKFFDIGFFGSSKLVKRFEKYHYPHKIMRFVDEGHGVAARMMDNYDDVIWFIDNMVTKGKNFEIDETVWDKEKKRTSWDSSKPDDLYK